MITGHKYMHRHLINHHRHHQYLIFISITIIETSTTTTINIFIITIRFVSSMHVATHTLSENKFLPVLLEKQTIFMPPWTPHHVTVIRGIKR